MHDISKTYNGIKDIVRNFSHNLLNNDGNVKRSGPKPKFSDLEVISLALTAEVLAIDSELMLFKKLLALPPKKQINNLIDRSRFNVRKRDQCTVIESIRQRIVRPLIENEDTFIVDSTPLETCKFVRAPRTTICKENPDTAPAYGYCASMKRHYFGYKLHAVCSLDGVISTFDLSQANINDVKYLDDIQTQYFNCTIIGDKGYISESIQQELFSTNQVRLATPMRENQLNYKPFPFMLTLLRKRIETLFSQLCDQFMLRRNYAKTFRGLITRLLAKITALSLLQYLNKFVLNRPIGKVKHAFI